MSMKMLSLAVPLFVCGCDGLPESMQRSAATPAAYAYAAEPGPDTFPTVARRVSPDFEGPAAPTADGRHLVVTDWETGDLAVRDLGTGEIRRITSNDAPYEPGYAMLPRVSPDGSRAVFHWDPLDGTATQLRVVGLDGSGERAIHEDEETGWIEPADWSPDGQAVLALRTVRRGGSVHMLLVPVEEGEARVLRTFEHDQPVGARFSGDGRFVVFDYRPDPDATERDIAVIDLDTGRERALVRSGADDYLLDWSPDGRHLLFSSDRAGTPGAWVLPVRNGRAEGEPVLVKPDLWRAEPVGFTADGSFYYVVRTGGSHVYTAALDPETGRVAGSPTRITRNPINGPVGLDLSHDGRSIVYRVAEAPPVGNRRQGLAIRSLETGEVRRFDLSSRPLLTNPRWSRDGRSVLLRQVDENTGFGLVRMDAQTGAIEDLFTLDPAHLIQGFHVLPGDESVVYRRATPDPEAMTATIRVRDLATGAERVLVEETASADLGRYVLSPDGARIAVLHRTGEDTYDVLIQPVDDGDPQRIRDIELPASPGGMPRVVSFTPDGQALLLLRVPEAGSEIRELVRFPLEGGPAEAVGVTMEGLGGVHVDPSGERLVFAAGGRGQELWVMSEFLPQAEDGSAAHR